MHGGVSHAPQAAYATCQSTRAQLRAASHEVQQQIKIITCTRTKQRCLQLYGTLSKFKQVQDLPAALRCVRQPHRHAPVRARACMTSGQARTCVLGVLPHDC
jgi:hypothetical protein